MFSIRSYIKNISKYKVQFSDHIFTNFLDFFHVDHRYKYQTEVWKKLQFLTNYCCLDNDDPISFFMILLRTQIFVYKDFSSTFTSGPHKIGSGQDVQGSFSRFFLLMTVG